MFELSNKLLSKIMCDLGEIEQLARSVKIPTKEIVTDEDLKLTTDILNVCDKLKRLQEDIYDETERQIQERDAWAEKECQRRVNDPV